MSTKPFEFEKALKELEDITTWFESADVDLDEGVGKFEHGMELVSQLKDHLTGVENRVEKIKQRFDGKVRSAANEAATESEAAGDIPPKSLAEPPAGQAGDSSQSGLF